MTLPRLPLTFMVKRVKTPYYVMVASFVDNHHDIICWQSSGGNKCSVLRAVAIDHEDLGVILVVVDK